MQINDYELAVMRTLLEKPDFVITPEQVMLAWNGLGIAGEAGEVADLIKKQVFHQQGIDRDKMKKELGDVLWYAVALCKGYGFTLEEVMQGNIDKLSARFPDGYDPKRTTFREGEAA